MSTSNTPAGWYPNPERAGQLRYWDGEAWTDHVHDQQPAAPAPQPEPPAPAAPPAAAPPQFGSPGQPSGNETIAVPPGGFEPPQQFGTPPSSSPQFGAPPPFGSQPPPGFAPPGYGAGGAKPETPGFIGAYTDVFKNYAEFGGRLSVGGYWRFFAINIVVVIVLFALVQAADVFVIFYGLYSLALLVPSLAAAVRRLHDTGKSGWMILIGLIPIVGAILIIVFLAQSGERQPNQYGPPPVQATA